MSDYDPRHDVMSDAPPRTVDFSQELTVSTQEKPTLAKSIVAGATALLTGVGTAQADGGITATEWMVLALGTVIAVASVWATTNKRS